MVGTPVGIINHSCLYFIVGVRPQDCDGTISDNRWNRCDDTIDNSHILSNINIWTDTSYIAFEQTA